MAEEYPKHSIQPITWLIALLVVGGTTIEHLSGGNNRAAAMSLTVLITLTVVWLLSPAARRRPGLMLLWVLLGIILPVGIFGLSDGLILLGTTAFALVLIWGLDVAVLFCQVCLRQANQSSGRRGNGRGGSS